ncbi:MAG: gliding motility-associated-like protein [Crocinitomix sp.]|jgi:gliding motility-associated-like protein
MRWFLITATLFYYCQLFGQINLVPNPSFEEYIDCPTGLTDLDSAKSWSPAHGTCDYYNACNNTIDYSPGYVGVPNNVNGYLNAHTGVAYAGFVSYSNPASKAREYMQTLLLEALEVGVEYEVSMYLSLPKGDEVNPVGPVGVYFTTDTLDISYTSGNLSLCCTPNVTFDTIPTVNGPWMLVTANYIATGGERLMIIGNFEKNENCVYIENPNYSVSCYFFVDDVSVIPVKDSVNVIDNVVLIEIEMPNIFTPNNDQVNDIFRPVKMKNIQESKLIIMNRWGQKIYETDDLNLGWDGTYKDKDCVDGTYFWKIEYVDVNGAQEGSHGIIQLVR